MAKSKGIGLASKLMGAPTTSRPSSDDIFQARDDMETLRRAEEIRMDRQRHRAAVGVAKTHQRALMKVTGRKK